MQGRMQGRMWAMMQAMMQAMMWDMMWGKMQQDAGHGEGYVQDMLFEGYSTLEPSGVCVLCPAFVTSTNSCKIVIMCNKMVE